MEFCGETLLCGAEFSLRELLAESFCSHGEAVILSELLRFCIEAPLEDPVSALMTVPKRLWFLCKERRSNVNKAAPDTKYRRID